jgi:hypothetical protein
MRVRGVPGMHSRCPGHALPIHAAGHRRTLRIGALTHRAGAAGRPRDRRPVPRRHLFSVQAVETHPPACFTQLAGGELDPWRGPEQPSRTIRACATPPFSPTCWTPFSPMTTGAPAHCRGAAGPGRRGMGTRCSRDLLRGGTRVACTSAGLTPRRAHTINDPAVVPLAGAGPARHLFAATRRGAHPPARPTTSPRQPPA